MRQYFDCKIAHSIFSIVLLNLSFDHNIELTKKQLVKKSIHLLLIIAIVPQFFKFLSVHTHNRSSMLSCKIYENTICDISYFSSDHKGWNKGIEIFIARFTPKISWINFLYFPFATFCWASRIY
jgi:hypothetical protein